MRTMTPTELTATRRILGMNKAEMARTLRTPYRTYQDWENGARPIPGVVSVAAELLVQKDTWVMQVIVDKISRGIEGELNNG